MRKILLFAFYLLLTHSLFGQENHTKSSLTSPITWTATSLNKGDAKSPAILKSPTLFKCKYGKAIFFNGKNNGIFLDKMPLKDLSQFTIEIIFRPDSGGNFEQRYFHCGSIGGDRTLLELRSSSTGWYLDAFVKSQDSKISLIDSTLIHPSNQWYRIALVMNNGLLTTYVNGRQELQGQIIFSPFSDGKTSIGMRQDNRSWFKGAIYKIIISPKALIPEKFTLF